MATSETPTDPPVDDMKIGEGKPGPGRPKGTQTKRQAGDLANIRELLTAKGYDPLGELIDQAKVATDQKERERLAMVILPYVWSKQPVHVAAAEGEDGEGGARVNVTVTL